MNLNLSPPLVNLGLNLCLKLPLKEIGRAGRDGKPARCHLFLDSEGKDLSELKRHIYSNSVDRHTIRKLLQVK